MLTATVLAESVFTTDLYFIYSFVVPTHTLNSSKWCKGNIYIFMSEMVLVRLSVETILGERGQNHKEMRNSYTQKGGGGGQGGRAWRERETDGETDGQTEIFLRILCC